MAYRLILSLLAALIVSPAHADITGTPRVDDGDTLKISGERAVAKAMKFWYGNIHAHTSEDSGENNIPESTHEEAFLYAMDDTKGNLDFLAITPHNHLVKKRSYKNLQITTNDPKYYIPGKFVPIAGQEYSSISKGNHINVFELDAWINKYAVPNGEFKKLFDEFIPAHKTKMTFAQFNHPNSPTFSGNEGREYGRDDYVGPDGSLERWIAATDPYVQVIEIVGAPYYQEATNRPHYDEKPSRVNAWLWALSKGWHLAPAANQDNHRRNWGSASDGRTVAISTALTRDSITDAFKERRVYASEDSTLQVTFKAGSSWMGSIVRKEDFGGFQVMAHDPEEPDAEYMFELFEGLIGGAALKHTSQPIDKQILQDGKTSYFYRPDARGGNYYFIRVTQSKTPSDHNGTEDNAWTAPIWIVSDAP